MWRRSSWLRVGKNALKLLNTSKIFEHNQRCCVGSLNISKHIPGVCSCRHENISSIRQSTCEVKFICVYLAPSGVSSWEILRNRWRYEWKRIFIPFPFLPSFWCTVGKIYCRISFIFEKIAADSLSCRVVFSSQPDFNRVVLELCEERCQSFHTGKGISHGEAALLGWNSLFRSWLYTVFWKECWVGCTKKHFSQK